MRKTKIVCTLGPATDSEEKIKELMLAGMDVARFNFSHGTHEEHLARYQMPGRTPPPGGHYAGYQRAGNPPAGF